MLVPAQSALDRLREGNRRFVAGSGAAGPRRSGAVHVPDPDDAAGQEPFAVILGCSDSRVPVEIIFDQGLGDLFVIRVAGNIVAPSQVGSIEFAADRFGTRLVVVLGHEHCGAVEATVDSLLYPNRPQSRNLKSILDRITPAVSGLMKTADTSADHDALVDQAVRANVRASVNQLYHGSDILEQLIKDDGLLIVGAEYSITTGVVEFLDEAT